MAIVSVSKESIDPGGPGNLNVFVGERFRNGDQKDVHLAGFQFGGADNLKIKSDLIERHWHILLGFVLYRRSDLRFAHLGKGNDPGENLRFRHGSNNVPGLETAFVEEPVQGIRKFF